MSATKLPAENLSMLSPVMVVDTHDERETIVFARQLAACLRAGDCIAMHGQLGAGKTTFTRALVRALSSENEDVPSPTFTLMQTYDVTLPGSRETVSLTHMDCYRLKSPDEAEELGLSEILASGITIIEWPEIIAPLLPPERLEIHLSHTGGENERRLALHGVSVWQERLAQVRSN